jgi:tetratricopeptide (TPR) repeat protein
LTAASAGDVDAAEAFYRRAITLAGSTATLHRNLADYLRLSRRLDEAMIHYAKALRIDPQLHHAAYALAEISTECGRLSDAVDHWQHAWIARSHSTAQRPRPDSGAKWNEAR